jgi:hypothetical protein
MLGFVSPWWLLLFPVLASALFYCYRIRSRPEQETVASLFLLKKLVSQSYSPKTVRLPLLFWLELVMLALILFVLAKPNWSATKKTAVILIDNSFSMSQILGSAKDRRSLLSLAKAEAAEIIRRSVSGTRFEIYASAPNCQNLKESRSLAAVSNSEATAQLQSLKLSFSEDQLTNCIYRLKRKFVDAQIYVVTDRAPSVQTESNLKVKTITSSADSYNLAVVGVDLAQGSTDLLSVDIAAFGNLAQEKKATLSLYSLGVSGERRLLREREVSLTSRVVSELLRVDPKDQIYYVELRATQRSVAEAFSLDNYAWYVRGKTARATIDLYSDRSRTELNLNQIKGFRFNLNKPEDYLNSSGPNGDAIIFDRFIPASLPDVNSLFLLPPDQSEVESLPRSESAVSNQPLLFVDEKHELLRYLDLNNWKKVSGRVVTGPIWLHSVMSVADGALLSAGVDHGSRYVNLGFDLFPFEGDRNLGVSILTLNVLNWLSLKAETEQVLESNLDSSEFKLIDGLSLEALGLEAYQTTGVWQSLAKTTEVSSQFMAKNFFSLEESDPIRKPLLISRDASKLDKHSPIVGAESDLTTATWALILFLMLHVFGLLAERWLLLKVRGGNE